MADLSWRKGLSLTITEVGDDPVNLVPNPRFANNIFDGWSLGGNVTPSWYEGGTPTLPTGMTAKLRLSNSTGTGTFRIAQFLSGIKDGNGSLIAVTPGESYSFGAYFYNPDGGGLITRTYWYDAYGESISWTDYTITGCTSGWGWRSSLMTAPANAVMCQPSFYLTESTPTYTVHFTGVVFAASPAALSSSQYVDGDMPGSRWEGRRHDSYSLKDRDRTWEIAREAQGVDFTTKMPGGFSKLSFLVSRAVNQNHDDLKRNNEVKLALDGASLFEGFIQSVEPELGDHQRVRVVCHGHWAKFGLEQTWRRVYRDTSLRAWKTDQNDDNAGLYYHDKADRLHIRIPKGVSAPAGSEHRLYYWLFNGVPQGDRIRKVEFDWDINLGSADSNWIADIMGRDDPDNTEQQITVWSKNGGTGGGHESIALTTAMRCLVLRLRRASTETAPSYDRYVKLTNVAVYGTSLSSVKVDTVAAEIAGELSPDVTTSADGDYTVDHASFRHYTSRARAIRQVCRYVDGEYDYAVWEDGAFTAGDRPDGSDIPHAKTIVVQVGQPGVVWNVRRDFDRAYDGVTVRYKRPEKGEGKELVELTRPAGGYSRVKALDHTRDHHMTDRMAAKIASRFLKRWQAGTERGEVVLTGDVATKDGVTIPSVQLRAGMWIENISLPGHRPLFISKVRTNLETGEVTLRVNDGDRRHLKHIIKLWNRRHDGEPN